MNNKYKIQQKVWLMHENKALEKTIINILKNGFSTMYAFEEIEAKVEPELYKTKDELLKSL